MTGKEIRKWRTDRGLSQAKLAGWLSCHKDSIRAWEKGRQKPPGMLHLALDGIQFHIWRNEALEQNQAKAEAQIGSGHDSGKDQPN